MFRQKRLNLNEKVCQKIIFLFTESGYLSLGFTLLCFPLTLVLKYQKYGLWGQWVVCGEKQQRCLSSQVEALAGAFPPHRPSIVRGARVGGKLI